jgi:cyanophycin synthetase
MPHKNIQFLKIFAINGPSIWTYRPVVEAWVDIGDLEDCPSNTIPGFVERLCAWLPTLSEHRCSYEEVGGFIKRLEEGTWPAHIMEHVTLELQNLADIPGGFGRAREAGPRGVYKVAISAPFEEVSRVSLEMGRDLVMAAIEDEPFDVEAAVSQLRTMAAAYLPGPSAACIIAAAEDKARKIPVVYLPAQNLVQLGYGAQQKRIWAADTEHTGAIAQGIAEEPELTHDLLKSCGLPVPAQSLAATADEAWAEAQWMGLPVNIMPGSYSVGDPGVKVSTREELMAAFENAWEEGSDVVVKKSISGRLHRLLVVSGTLVATAPLDGDGEHGSDLTGHIHPSTEEAVILAAKIVGLDVTGIDVVVRDVSRPLSEQEGAITAVHAGRRLIRHLQPDSEESRLIGRSVINGLFPDASDGRIPIVGVIGSSGCNDVARLVAEYSRLSGKMTALACGDGVFYNRRHVKNESGVNWQSGRHLLINRATEVAVIESSADMILGEGLPYDRCQVAIVTGVSPEQHFGEYYVDSRERVLQVMRTQVDVVLPTGIAVLNAADAMAVELAPFCDGEVIYFAVDARSPVIAEHLANGGRAVIVRSEQLALVTSTDETLIAPLTGIPFLTDDDAFARLSCVLAATAAAWALEISLHVIRTGIETFSNTISNPNQAELPFFDGPTI